MDPSLEKLPATADIVIIGAGSAGCLLANRLSADPARRVVLVEAGGQDWNPLLRVPLMGGVLYRGRLHNWSYETEPEPHLDGRRIPWPRGKVLGGSSAINGMVHVRGLPSDYDAWAQGGLPGWSYERVLPFFKRSETTLTGTDADRGREGALPVNRPPRTNPLFESFVAAAREAGLPETKDFNGPAPDGVGWYDMTVARGSRWSSARAFLHPVRHRPNLRVVTRASLVRVTLQGTRATGVELRRAGRIERLAAGTVVLCCGAIETPAALMRSGIGDPDRLAPLGIPVHAALPDVGRHLQDHLIVRVQHLSTQPVTLHHALRMDRAVAALVQAMALGTGPASAFPLLAGAYLRSDPALDEPDLQSSFVPGLSTSAMHWSLPFDLRRRLGLPQPPPTAREGFFANVQQMRPESTGEITLRGTDPHDKPVIRANYLAAPNDRAVLRRGVRRLREILAQPAFDWCRGPEIAPGPDATTDADLDRWIAATATTAFHPVGTCRMGAEGRGVVDAELRVQGINGLRVADASVMPRITSANTNAPTLMIAERAADLVAGGA
jgi:choline dehydrogenase